MASQNRNGDRKRISKRQRREADRLREAFERFAAASEGLANLHKNCTTPAAKLRRQLDRW